MDQTETWTQHYWAPQAELDDDGRRPQMHPAAIPVPQLIFPDGMRRGRWQEVVTRTTNDGRLWARQG